MFFANPVAGLRNMRKALRPGGRMVHIVWRARADNPWLSMAKEVSSTSPQPSRRTGPTQTPPQQRQSG
jgi:hypothetical protein